MVNLFKILQGDSNVSKCIIVKYKLYYTKIYYTETTKFP